MQEYNFTIGIEAKSQEEAKQLLEAMLCLMTTTIKELSAADFIKFAKAVKAKPKLIKKAQYFI